MRTWLARALGVCALLSTVGAVSEEAAKPGVSVEDVVFRAKADGSFQRYVVLLPEGFRKDAVHDVLVALHGHGSDRWQFVRDPRDECRAARDAAAKHDMVYVSPDYRAPASWMGPKAEADTEQIIGEIKERYRTGRVFLCGGSMGGTACLVFAIRHPELITGVASMNATANLIEYGNFRDAIAASFGGTKAEVPDEYRNRSAEFFPERLTMPVGLTAGGKDNLVPAASVLRLAERLETLGRSVLLVYREGGGHATDYEDASTILEFMLTEAKAKDAQPGGKSP